MFITENATRIAETFPLLSTMKECADKTILFYGKNCNDPKVSDIAIQQNHTNIFN